MSKGLGVLSSKVGSCGLRPTESFFSACILLSPYAGSTLNLWGIWDAKTSLAKESGGSEQRVVKVFNLETGA